MILFDHDGDLNRNATGWVKGDDGFLVLDRNGNGKIDNGSELFGVDTVMSNGLKASSGFEALRDLDTNADGIFSSADALLGDVRVWRDLNQDGVSQSDELKTLDELGIASIDLNEAASVTDLGNGNGITATSTFTRTDGTTGTAANLDLAQDTFHSDFVNPIELSAQAKELPFMYGSGQVRDLQEAATLSSDLADTLAGFDGVTRDQMWGQMGTFIRQWSDTSTMKSSVETAGDRGVKLIYVLPGQWMSDYAPFMGSFADYIMGNTACADLSSLSTTDQQKVENLRAQQMQISSQMEILEHFNGNTFLRIPDTGTDFQTGAGENLPIYQYIVDPANSINACYASLSSTQITLLNQAYDVLKESVYEGIVVQSRLDTYQNDIVMQQDGENFIWDYSGLTTRLENYKQTDNRSALIDLIELIRYGGLSQDQTGWYGMSMLRTWVTEAQGNSELQATLSQLDVIMGSGDVSGNADRDIIFGLSGDDDLSGLDGSDIFDGGSGNDHLSGGTGSDIYRFGLGDGYDHINNYASDYSTATDVLELEEGITPDMVTIQRSTVYVDDNYRSMAVKINGTSDQVWLYNFLYNSSYPIDYIQFADGTTWDVQEIKRRALIASSGNDTIKGYSSHDLIDGLAGNDSLMGDAGNDAIYGGDGVDNLYGQAGNDILDGGAGNDALHGGDGSDIYRFGIDGGYDWIYNSSSDYSTATDVLELKEGITPDMVSIQRSGYGDNYQSIGVKVNGTTDQVWLYYFLNSDVWAIDYIQFADGTTWDVQEIRRRSLLGSSGNDTIKGYSSHDLIDGLAGNDSLMGDAGNDTIHGGDGTDALRGQAGNDILDGGAGNDALHGDEGNDILDGGAGNDILWGNGGNDIYRFGIGDGSDRIYNSSSDYSTATDVLELEEGITPSMVTLQRSTSSLDNYSGVGVQIDGTSDQVWLDYFLNSQYSIDSIRFSDGLTWTEAMIRVIISMTKVNGGAGDDLINGNTTNDFLSGGAGNDTLYGGAGWDMLYGGSGDDYLFGGDGNDFIMDGGLGNDTLRGGDSGSDKYLFGRNDGQDLILYSDTAANNIETLVLDYGITTADVTVWREADDLFMGIIGTSDQVQVQNFFSDSALGGYAIEGIKFGDGTLWDVNTLKAKVLEGTPANDQLYGYSTADTIDGLSGDDALCGNDGNDILYGRDGNDTLNGGAGDDTLFGGAGNDALDGGAGSDTYLFGSNDGLDRINNNDSGTTNTDVLRSMDATKENLWFSRDGDNLVVTVAGTTDQVTINNWYGDAAYQLDTFYTSEYQLQNAMVDQLVNAMTAYDVPFGAGNVIPQDVQDQLAPIIITTWQLEA